MMGSFLTRGLVMVLGYAYPAYECFKTVEKNKPEIEQLIFWCQYWILVAVLTVFERVGDTFISWLPMYSEAKLAFFVYLWYPKTRGTTYVYDSFLKPYFAKHENEIDRYLLELRARAGDMAVLYWQKASSYGQTRIFDVLQYVASQSSSRPAPAQQQRHPTRPAVPPSTRRTGPQEQPLQSASGQPPSPSTAREQPDSVKEAASSQAPPEAPGSPNVRKTAVESTSTEKAAAGPSQAPKAAALPSQAPKAASGPSQAPKVASGPINSTKTNASQSEGSSQTAPSSREEPMQVDIAEGNANPPSEEIIMEEASRVTRARARKNRVAGNR